jgi:hypothetical protein
MVGVINITAEITGKKKTPQLSFKLIKITMKGRDHFEYLDVDSKIM